MMGEENRRDAEEIGSTLPNRHPSCALQRPKKPRKTGWSVEEIGCELGKLRLRENRRSWQPPRGGADHRHDAGADGLGESSPGGHDGGQIGIGLTGVVDTRRRKRRLMWGFPLVFQGPALIRHRT